jgi:hypothetical protein
MSFNNPIRRFFDLTPADAAAIAKEQAKITAEQQKQKSITEDLVDAYDVIENELDSISKLINKQLKDQGASVRQVSEIKSIYSSLNKTNRELQYLNEKYYEGTLKTKDVSKQLVQNEKDYARIQRQITLALDQGNKTLAAKFEKQARTLGKIIKEGEELKKQNGYIDKRVGLTGKLLSGLEKIPILGEAIDFEEINTSMRNAVGNTNVFGAGLKTAGKQLKEGLRDPLVQFALLTAFYGKIIKAAYSHNELLTKTGNLLGASKEEARGLYEESFKYSTTAHNSFITAERLLESQIKLNTTLGTSVNLGDKNAEAFARLNHFYGLSEESAGKLVELGVEQDKNGIDILNTTGKTFGIQKAQYGGTLALNKVLDKVANVSSDIYVNFKGNTESIARSVMNADRLGLSLDKVSQIGESLLNFESSIENELKAELLTGKQLNLEKAREYALSGDIENLTKEISKQVGGIHEFEKMNVIQRKAYAEAMGMSVQEMSTMLRKQEFEAKLAGSTAKSAKEKLEYAEKNGIKIDDALKQQYEQKSLADEQKEVFEKINSIIGKITEGPMAKFLEIIEKVLHKVNNVFEAFGKFTGGIAGDALGAVLLGAPLLIGATRLLTGGIKSMLIPKPTGRTGDPIHTVNDGGGGGGIMDIISGGKGTAGKRALVTKFGSAGAAKLAMKGLKGGGIASALGLGTELVAGQMEDGGAKDVVSGLGQTASYAGTGAMIGSVIPGIGTAVGAIVGGGIGLIKSFFDAEDSRKEREAQDRKSSEEQMKKTTDLLNQLAVRPINLNVGGKTIMEYNTASDLFGTQNSSFK